MLEYLMLMVAFGATLVGVVGKTTRDDVPWPKNVTALGWFTITLASISLFASIAIKHQAELEKTRAQYWGFRELEFATYKLLAPYIAMTDRPEAEDRFHYVASLNEIGLFAHFCKNLDLNEVTDHHDGPTYGRLCTESTSDACTAMGDVLSRYITVLPVETVELVSTVRTHPWTQIMLDAHRIELRDRARYPSDSAPRQRRLQGPLYINAATDFGLLVQKLEEHLGVVLPQAAKKLQIKDEPAFLLPLNRVELSQKAKVKTSDPGTEQEAVSGK